MRLKPLQDQTIVITGGSSGIGLATARRAAQRGANVVILARRQEGLDAAAAQIREAADDAIRSAPMSRSAQRYAMR